MSAAGSRDSEIDSGKCHCPRAGPLTISSAVVGTSSWRPCIGSRGGMHVTHSRHLFSGRKWRNVGIEMLVHRALCEITDMESHAREVGSRRFSFIFTTEQSEGQLG
jgi:hypothetical protein